MNESDDHKSVPDQAPLVETKSARQRKALQVRKGGTKEVK